MPCVGEVATAAALPARLTPAAAPCMIGPGGVDTVVLLPNGDRLRIESPTRPIHDFFFGMSGLYTFTGAATFRVVSTGTNFKSPAAAPPASSPAAAKAIPHLRMIPPWADQAR